MRPANEALIVIDMQYDFCPEGALAVAGGDAILPGINALMDDGGCADTGLAPGNHSSPPTT